LLNDWDIVIQPLFAMRSKAGPNSHLVLFVKLILT
jgi:hypothetical protein